MQIINPSAAELPGLREARKLAGQYAFGADAWPGWAGDEAAAHALETLAEAESVWVLADAAGWKWLTGYKPLEFDTRLFGRRMAALLPVMHAEPWPEPGALSEGREFLAKAAAAAALAGHEFMSARVPARDMLAAQALSRAGFLLMDVSVEWLTELENQPARTPPPPGVTVRPSRPADKEALVGLASSAMCDLNAYADRFAMDPRLKSHCPELYRRWLVNSLEGEVADMVLVLEYEDAPAGFITLRQPPAGPGPGADCGWVALNAIDPDIRGKGLYNHMLARGFAWLAKHGAKRARVRTKASQNAVTGAFAKVGGRQVSADLTFHLWLDQI